MLLKSLKRCLITLKTNLSVLNAWIDEGFKELLYILKEVKYCLKLFNVWFKLV